MPQSHTFALDEIAIDNDGNCYLITGSKSGVRAGDAIKVSEHLFFVLEIEYYSESDIFMAKVSGAAA